MMSNVHEKREGVEAVSSASDALLCDAASLAFYRRLSYSVLTKTHLLTEFVVSRYFLNVNERSGTRDEQPLEA